MTNNKDYKRKTQGRRAKDEVGKDMKNANFWLKVMTIILTLSMFATTWIARDINQLKSNVSANYTMTQVILTKLTTHKENLNRETKERKEGEEFARVEREAIRRKVNTHIVESYQTLNDDKYRK